MHQYDILLKALMEDGRPSLDRTGVGTKSLFGDQIRFDISKDFPILTTKKVFFKAIVHELLWFLKGSTDTKYLKEHGINIWDGNAKEHGELGPIYGYQWRSWPDYIPGFEGENQTKYIDQIANVIEDIKSNPFSRRHIVSAWNVADVPKMALPPCHLMFQFDVYDGELSCHMYQRSADYFLGVPFNIASYALLTMMIAQVTGLKAKELIISFGNYHVYNNHVDQVAEQLTRSHYKQPRVELNPLIKNIDDFTYDDIKLIGYESHPAIWAPMAV